MVGYDAIQQAVVAKFITRFSDELSEDTCAHGDLDKVLGGVFDTGSGYGCMFEYAGFRNDAARPFDTPVGIWSIFGVFMIRYTDDIEARLVSIVTKLAGVFDGDHTLGGVVPRVRITSIKEADPVQLNDVPFYWLPFMVEALDR